MLIDDSNVYSAPSVHALEAWNAEREAAARLQISAAEAEKVSEKANKLATSDEAIRKRKEREAKRAAAARAKAIAEGLPVNEAVLTASSPQMLEDRPGTPSKAASQAFNVTIPASSSELGWYAPDTCAYTTLDAARQAGVWVYPSSSFERAKCRVFRDLWEKGNFMGGGIKFGGDFLVYPGQ